METKIEAQDIIAAVERERLRRAGLTYDGGQVGIPSQITSSDPYFYVHLFPCRPLSPGAYWRAGAVTPTLFNGAAIRTYEGASGDREIEVIGRCDKRKLAGIYDNRLPWVQVYFDSFIVPASNNAWAGDPDTVHDFALLRMCQHGMGFSSDEMQRKLKELSQDIERTKQWLHKNRRGPDVERMARLLKKQEGMLKFGMDQIAVEKLYLAIKREANGW